MISLSLSFLKLQTLFRPSLSAITGDNEDDDNEVLVEFDSLSDVREIEEGNDEIEKRDEEDEEEDEEEIEESEQEEI